MDSAHEALIGVLRSMGIGLIRSCFGSSEVFWALPQTPDYGNGPDGGRLPVIFRPFASDFLPGRSGLCS
jgi:hypothetical protein